MASDLPCVRGAAKGLCSTSSVSPKAQPQDTRALGKTGRTCIQGLEAEVSRKQISACGRALSHRSAHAGLAPHQPETTSQLGSRTLNVDCLIRDHPVSPHCTDMETVPERTEPHLRSQREAGQSHGDQASAPNPGPSPQAFGSQWAGPHPLTSLSFSVLHQLPSLHPS